MNIFQADNLSKAFGTKVLFDNISFSIDKGQKAALIAKNGTGKSTLLNIIAGDDAPDSGQCTFKNEINLSYLPQNPRFDPEITLEQALFSTDNEVAKTVLEYERFLNEDNKSNHKNLTEITAKMDDLNAWDFEAKLKMLVTKLKIGNLKRKVSGLSGGQIKRLALAKILLQEAEFIILDEPTNHLDIQMIEWLENYLAKKNLSLLVVSHDRYFIDSVCNQIIELDNSKIYKYSGNYTYFVEKKLERESVDAVKAEKAKNLLKKEVEWMKKSPPARTTKSKARLKSINELEDKAKDNTSQKPNEILAKTSRIGKKILEVKNISKSFNETKLINNFSYNFKRNDKIGIVGPNGSGKSTFLNIITQNLKPDTGSVITGETIKYGYYKQEGLIVNKNKKVIDVIKDISEVIQTDKDKTLTASQFLYYFNFPYEKQNDFVDKLSGGEMRRLYLISILMNSPNFLILDEPTNDLDIPTLNVLEDFLNSFSGCVLVVSHDRYFLDKVVDHVFAFDESKPVKDFPGNYTEYSSWLAANKVNQPKPNKQKKKKDFSEKSSEKKKLTYKENKELENIEKEIPALEDKKKELLEKMNSGKLNHEELEKVSKLYSETEKELEIKTNRWLELSEFL